MCGPIAAAASATAVASSSRTFTAAMLPSAARSCVSVRGRSLVQVVGEVEEVDVPRRLAHPRQQHRRVAELLLRVCVDVQQVVPEWKAFFRRRAGLEIVDLRERVVVECRKPGPHLPLVAAPVVDERGGRRVVGHPQLLLPHGLGLSLKSRAPTRLDVERVHERPPQVAGGYAGWGLELRPGELRRAIEHAVLHPVAEAEQRLEVLPAHGFERNAMRRATRQSAGVAGTNVNAGSFGERLASAAIAMRSRSSSSCTSSPRFIARMYARSRASPSSGSPSSASRAWRPRRPESFDTTIRRASQPTDCGVMIS